MLSLGYIYTLYMYSTRLVYKLVWASAIRHDTRNVAKVFDWSSGHQHQTSECQEKWSARQIGDPVLAS